ncbi:MAG: hypothetical protein VB070_11930 [Clostridiaceae bacterium]|nr:hypothetical protein [Clostridiaceae bacterium]
MKWEFYILLIICFLFLFVGTACSLKETDNSIISTSSLSTTENTSSNEEKILLEKENTELINENKILKHEVSDLEEKIETASILPLLNNYHIDELLQKMYTEKSLVDIFPGVLQSIRIETIDETIYFIFSIDRMAINPDWNGEGSADGKGYFINTEVKFQNHRGGLGTVFASNEYSGYETYQEKQDAILSEYDKQGIYNFYMIGDEIVFVGPDPGP